METGEWAWLGFAERRLIGYSLAQAMCQGGGYLLYKYRRILNSDRRGDWMQTFTGRQFWPMDPRPEEIDIEDIAHALSMMCRYNGHCTDFYSVAEHSVLISRSLPNEYALWGLLHDASEAYIGDIVRPAKRYIAGYHAAEQRIMAAVRQAFGLALDMPDAVKRADNAILADEQRQIMGIPPRDWNLIEPPLGVKIRCLYPDMAKQEFLARFYELCPNYKRNVQKAKTAAMPGKA